MNAQRAITRRFVQQAREDAALLLGRDDRSEATRQARLAELERRAEGYAADPASAPRHWREWVVACAMSYGLDADEADLLLGECINAAGAVGWAA